MSYTHIHTRKGENAKLLQYLLLWLDHKFIVDIYSFLLILPIHVHFVLNQHSSIFIRDPVSLMAPVLVILSVSCLVLRSCFSRNLFIYTVECIAYKVIHLLFKVSRIWKDVVFFISDTGNFFSAFFLINFVRGIPVS